MYTVTDLTILFYIKTADLIDRLKMYSGSTVRPLVENEKTNIKLEELVLTDDETKLILAESDRAITKIFQIAYKLSRNLTGVVLKNTSITIDTVATPVYGFYVHNKKGYNPNLLPLIDTNIEDLLISMILIKWYTITRQFDLLKQAQVDYPSLVMNYAKSLNELYKPKFLGAELVPITDITVIVHDPITDTTTDVETVNPDEMAPFKDTIQFIFSDIDTDPGQVYILDLKAKFAYTVTQLALKSDAGTITVNVAINGTQIDGLTEIDATGEITEFNAQTNNVVAEGDEVSLEIINLQDTPGELTGTLFLTRA